MFSGLRSLFTRRRVDRDIQRELQHHVAMETEHRARTGMSPDEARRTALRDFGGVERIREEVRDARGMRFWDTLSQDVRFGVRTLRRSPGYTLAAMLILGLGIGANTAMFSVIDGVLLKPLPFRSGDELVLLRQSAPQANIPNVNVSILELYDYRKRLQSVRDLVEHHAMSFTLLNQGEPDRVDTGVVSANFFDMLGIRPVHGRSFNDRDDDLGAEAVLMLSNEYWQSKFGGDPNVIGRVLEMNNRPHTVVGVLPAYPQYPQRQDVYMPTSACPFRAGAEQNPGAGPGGGHRAFGALTVFGRLAPGVSEGQASAEVATVAGKYDDQFPDNYQGLTGFTGATTSLREQLVTGARPLLLALGGATLLVLLIACANVANLALARTVRRGRELALRTALGADRRRLIRQLLTESLIVATAGGALGLFLAWLTLDMLVLFVGRFTPRTGQISIDGTVLAFTLGVSVVTGLVFGIAPAFGSRRHLANAMRDGAAQGGEGARRQRTRSILVVAQVAVSFVLVVGAALLLESFYRLSAVPLGYQSEQVMTANIFGNFTRTGNAADSIRVQRAVLERLRAAPGVRFAGVTNLVPQLAAQPTPFEVLIEGRASTPGRRFLTNGSVASEGYFEAIDVPLLAGRDFRSTDTADSPRVVIINASMAKYWDGADPIGARIAPRPAQGAQPLWRTVIGVVADFRLYSVDGDLGPQIYQSVMQTGGGGRLVVRAAGLPRDLVPTIKAAVHGVDPLVPVEEIQTLEEIRNGRLQTPGLTTALLSIFAIIALVISLAGIAGLIGTSVSQRTREFGLRMALGASRTSVLRMVLNQGLLLVAIGVALGVGGAYAFSHLIAQFLFQTTPYDVGAYVAVGVVFVVAAAIATYAPARRATTVDPLKALKTD